MHFHLTEPNPGDRVSANLVREIVRAIRSLTPVSGHGVRITRGPHGTVYNAKTAESATAKSESAPGCYEIESIDTEEDDTLTISFKNPYYRCGGLTYTDDNASDGSVSLTQVTPNAFVALSISATGNTPEGGLATYADFAALHSAEAETDKYIIPLYKIGSEGEVECDFRKGPNAAMFEFAESSGGSSS